MVLQQMLDRVPQDWGFLSHFFVMLEANYQPTSSWQIGFYEKEKDLVRVYELAEPIVKKESKPFKKQDSEVQKLKLDDVKLEFEDAINRIKALLAEKYSADTPTKIMVLLQTLDGTPQWNITCITNTFHTIHVRISAKTGEILEEEKATLLSWKG